jgi:hypothetical protein
MIISLHTPFIPNSDIWIYNSKHKEGESDEEVLICYVHAHTKKIETWPYLGKIHDKVCL